MYVDKRRKRYPLIIFAAVTAAIAVFLLQWGARTSGEDMGEESAAALKAAVERSALQCYVVEENYGLQINREDFFVAYDIFASNLPPDVRVVSRE